MKFRAPRNQAGDWLAVPSASDIIRRIRFCCGSVSAACFGPAMVWQRVHIVARRILAAPSLFAKQATRKQAFF